MIKGIKRRKHSSVDIVRGGTTGELLKEFHKRYGINSRNEEIMIIDEDIKRYEKDPKSILEDVIKFIESLGGS